MIKCVSIIYCESGYIYYSITSLVAATNGLNGK